MAIKKRLSSLANENNLLILGDDLKLNDGDVISKDYQSAVVDHSTNGTVDRINVTPRGGSAQDLVFAGGAVDWTDAANDDALRAAIETAVGTIDYIAIDGGIEIARADANSIQVTIRNSSLVFNYIDVSGAAFTAIERL